ncbi:sensor histidine kinase [Luteolibacter sp. LG18]|uniref:sensor histidine kinase n=1 Tax=Luteolibacter sp. LG18 TaxID=2819286 RepID=UPI0030C683A1
MRFELVSSSGSLVVEVPENGLSPLLQPGCKVQVRGACFGARGTGGMRIASGLLASGPSSVEVEDLPAVLWRQMPVVPLASLNPATNPEGCLVHLRGVAASGAEVGSFRLLEDSKEIAVSDRRSPAPGTAVEVLGLVVWLDGRPRVTEAAHRVWQPGESGRQARPLVSTIREVRALPDDDLPMKVRIRGVVTCDQDSHSVTVQEAGAGVTCWLASDQSPALKMGDEVELEGRVIRGAFAPNLMDASVRWLGKGTLPEPARPPYDRLWNGSLNAQWVEVEGVVRKVEDGLLTLGLPEGTMGVWVLHGDLPAMASLHGAVVRARGIVAPFANEARQIRGTYLRVSSPLFITVVSAAGADPFAVPAKRLPELRKFDPAGASAFHRVRVSGLVIHTSARECFLWDGDQGAVFTTREPVALVPGTTVEVSGMPELEGPAPVLLDAVVRATGSAPLPEPVAITPAELLDRSREASRVRIRATLVEIVSRDFGQLLELQGDHWKFSARLPTGVIWNRPPAPGSVLELTGICSSHRNNDDGGTRTSAILLLNQPSDVVILSSPPWWTVRRILGLAATLSLVLVMAAAWIVQLRRKVEERTAQLVVEIHQREIAEQRRLIEEERSRIARDLHDDLGARVTKIAMLAEREGQGPHGMEPGVRHILDTSHELTRAMDEVVWTVNPRNDALPMLGDYLLHYAEKYFEGTGVRVRLRSHGGLPDLTVTASMRHHLFLAVKEALRNVMKHSAATECRVEVDTVDGMFHIQVADNGRGFSGDPTAGPRNGLRNMVHRLEQLGGRCSFISAEGQGTIVIFEIALDRLVSPKDAARVPTH